MAANKTTRKGGDKRKSNSSAIVRMIQNINYKHFRKGIIGMLFNRKLLITGAILAFCALGVPAAFSQALPSGTLDPLTIPKYVTPLVIPPVMNNDGTGADNYDIAVRQFQQQILPGGIWDVLAGTAFGFPATPIWSYGPAADPTPAIAPDPNSQFNYPAYTFETMPTDPYGPATVPVNVRWINELVMNPDDCFLANGMRNPAAAPGSCDFRPHLLPIDQTLHWANPPATGCRDGSNRTDCATNNPALYTGPVPIVTHVHGAHVDEESDGYPEAWWLPDADGILAGYAMSGTLFNDSTLANHGNLGYADYSYRQDQPATTLWYHDHSLGMTRSNVYAGPAGFWIVRGGVNDGAIDNLTGLPALLPGPAPAAGDTVLELNAPNLVPGTIDKRSAIREIPIVIQDRSFNADGSLFYPDNRAFFEGLNVQGTAGTPNEQFLGAPELQIPFVPNSDIAPTWNPEAFFNVMVVNGVSWPTLEVAPALYRFRLLNGCNSRFLNLALQTGMNKGTKDIPFYQIGAEQGFLRQVVRIETGFATPLPADGTDVKTQWPTCVKKNGKPVPNCAPQVPASDPQQALLMGLAERADVIVDFRGLVDGDIVRMINTAPDAPFGGFPDVPADPATTGQVMQFVVNSALLQPADVTTTPPQNLVLNAEAQLGGAALTRHVSLNEGESEELCVDFDLAGNLAPALNSLGDPVLPTNLDPNTGLPCYDGTDEMVIGFPMAPKEALLGTVDCVDAAGNPTGVAPCAASDFPVGNPLKWTANGIGVAKSVTVPSGTFNVWVTENPAVDAVEDWAIYNFTADAHPIHQHLVRFEVINRAAIPGWMPVNPIVQPWEVGMKDTVISYPGEITTIRSHFDVAGLYVWHCHIVEHEDNEMMRPYYVGP